MSNRDIIIKQLNETERYGIDLGVFSDRELVYYTNKHSVEWMNERLVRLNIKIDEWREAKREAYTQQRTSNSAIQIPTISIANGTYFVSWW